MEVEPERISDRIYLIHIAEIQNFPWERKYENTFEEDEDEQKEVESRYCIGMWCKWIVDRMLVWRRDVWNERHELIIL